MKKLIALTLIGVMLCSLPVCAATSPSAGTVTETKKEAAVVDGIPAAVVAAAAAENKTVGEYNNNAVAEVPGLPDAVPTGQGGHVLINGAPSNVTFFLTKPNAATVKAAKEQATALGGKVLNVFGTSAVVGKFENATVNFYMKGVKAGGHTDLHSIDHNILCCIILGHKAVRTIGIRCKALIPNFNRSSCNRLTVHRDMHFVSVIGFLIIRRDYQLIGIVITDTANCLSYCHECQITIGRRIQSINTSSLISLTCCGKRTSTLTTLTADL